MLVIPPLLIPHVETLIVATLILNKSAVANSVPLSPGDPRWPVP